MLIEKFPINVCVVLLTVIVAIDSIIGTQRNSIDRHIITSDPRINRTNNNKSENGEQPINHVRQGSMDLFSNNNTNRFKHFFYSPTTQTLINNLKQRQNRKYVYLNYKKAYGIRYDPGNETPIKLRFSNNNHSNSVDARKCNQTNYQINDIPNKFGPAITTQVPTGVNATIVTTTLSSPITLKNPLIPDISTTTNLRPLIDNSNNISENDSIEAPTAVDILAYSTQATPLNYNNTILRPNANNLYGRPTPSNGYIRSVLDYLGNKLRQLFAYGVQLNVPLPTKQPSGPRFLNLFNVIKFDNIPCQSNQPMLEEMSGTCYHDEECRQMNGIAVDNCADGFGVCCACKTIKKHSNKIDGNRIITIKLFY